MSALESILSHFDQPKQVGKNWRVRCPAHDDHTPSLDIALGDNGKVMLNCRSANCSAEEICRAVGVTTRDLAPSVDETSYHARPPGMNGNGRQPSNGTPTGYSTAQAATASLEARSGPRAGSWDYHNEEGEHVGTVLRWSLGAGKKDIRPISRVGHLWQVAAMPEPRPLYRLPDLADAKSVVVAEGEKAADAARSLGFIATTSAGGSAAPMKTDWSPLAGKEVILLPDNDEPGRKYEAVVTGILKKLTPPAIVTVVNLPGLPDKGDIVDWIEARGDAAEPGAMRGDIEELVRKAKPKPRFTFIASAEFAGSDYRPTWLIPKVLVKGQPGVVAGPSKSLKTSLMIDAAVSLASGTPFMGQFEVPVRSRVAIVSGESGPHTLQETAYRICVSRGVALSALEGLTWCFDLPTFTDVAGVHEFAEGLLKLRADVVMIDPLYLSLGAVDAANMFEMGAALRTVSDVLLKAGVTLIVAHHANRGLKVGEPMELTHLAYSGLEQFARQFILLNRRSAYQSDGTHDIWFRVGGSAGHGGLWSVRIEEGVTDANFGGRSWSVEVTTASESFTAERTKKEIAKRDDAGRKRREEETAVLKAIDAATDGEGATRRQIRDATGFNYGKVKDVVSRLLEDDEIEEVEVTRQGGNGAKQRTTGYRRPG